MMGFIGLNCEINFITKMFKGLETKYVNMEII